MGLHEVNKISCTLTNSSVGHSVEFSVIILTVERELCLRLRLLKSNYCIPAR